MGLTSLQNRFKEQLPKYSEWASFDRIIGLLGIIISIVSLGVAVYAIIDKNTDDILKIYLIVLIVVALLFFGYSMYLSTNKTTRYAKSLVFVHYVNHIIRDTFQTKVVVEIEPISENLLTQIATCFSIITGKKCSATIWELEEGSFDLKKFAMDSISKLSPRDDEEGTHSIEENTEFIDVWKAQNGCTRYYLSNDLLRAWKYKDYQNSSFKYLGYPEHKPIFFIDRVVNWKLHYKSTLVLPIRYIENFMPPKEMTRNHDHWRYFGFLCIDCDKKNVFDKIYCPELGGAFADAMYTLFSIHCRLMNKINPPTTLNVGETNAA